MLFEEDNFDPDAFEDSFEELDNLDPEEILELNLGGERDNFPEIDLDEDADDLY